MNATGSIDIESYAGSGGFELVVRYVPAYSALHQRIVGKLVEGLPADLVGSSSVPKVLDAGCGPGFLVEMSTKALPEAEVYGLEFQHGNCMEAMKRAPSAKITQGDIQVMPFKDGQFDGVSVVNVLYLVDQEAALRELARVVRPGGVVVISEPLNTASMLKIILGEVSVLVSTRGIAGLWLLSRGLVRDGRALVAALRYNSEVVSGVRGVTKHSQKGWVELVKKAGFTVELSELAYHGQNVLIVARRPASS